MRTFDSPRFGPLEVEEDTVLSFAKGLPGFPDCTEFVVMDHDKETPLKWLHCIDRPEVAFLIVDPAQVLASYQLEIPAHVLGVLGWDEKSDQPGDVAIFVILNAAGTELTANLRAPVVAHLRTRSAFQLILEDPKLSLRHVIAPPAGEQG